MPPPPPLRFRRDTMLDFIESDGRSVDVLVIGGGATGLYTALDAASRGYSTVLLERGDFAGGTSSASTKLVHGGVRYLRQGRVGLVRESLRERALLRRNAPHIVRPLEIAVPAYSRWDGLKTALGLHAYSLLARGGGFARARSTSAELLAQIVPGISSAGLRGGVVFADGQMDDARLAIAIAKSAAAHGAAVLNYVNARNLKIDSGRVTGAEAEDLVSGRSVDIKARVVVNATGIYADDTAGLEETSSNRIMRWSRGTHLVMDGSLLSNDTGILIPDTSDGRVVFALPWLGKTLVGTTDVPVEAPNKDERPPREDIDFLVSELGRYLPSVRESKLLSAFTGVRPLVADKPGSPTSKLARSHKVIVSPGRLVTIAGGKWTTARLMAEQTVTTAARVGGLAAAQSVTGSLRLHGAPESATFDPATTRQVTGPDSLYGSDLAQITNLEREIPGLSEPIHKNLAYRLSHAVFAVREEMAHSLEDVLARRTRSFVLDVDAAEASAGRVASALKKSVGWDDHRASSELRAIPPVATRYRPTK